MKKVLVLGAGLVAGPTVHYLLDHEIEVTVASIISSQAKELVGNHPHGKAVELDVSDKPALTSLIKENDLTISLLPATMHVMVAEICLDKNKHLVTSSYVKPEMRALDQRAKEAGLLFLNELGLDPGIDHMSAMEVIDRVKKDGGTIVDFSSSCGGLPSPKANDNPLGYKFSWSPKGVLLAANNSARYLRDGKVVEVPGEELFDHFHDIEIQGLGGFECYPNRNSLEYIELYGLEDAKGFFRGTIRNQGHCESWRKMVDFGMFGTEEADASGLSYKQFMARLLTGNTGTDPAKALMDKYDIPANAPLIEKLSWLGMFEDVPCPKDKIAPIDLILERMLEKMMFNKGERDLVVLQHKFHVEYPDRKEEITCDLIDFGFPNGDSSMSRTVGLPAAVGARLILQGKIKLTGVYIPNVPEIYVPVLKELANMNIKLNERVETK